MESPTEQDQRREVLRRMLDFNRYVFGDSVEVVDETGLSATESDVSELIPVVGEATEDQKVA